MSWPLETAKKCPERTSCMRTMLIGWLVVLVAWAVSAGSGPRLALPAAAQEAKSSAEVSGPVTNQDLDQTWPAAAFNAHAGEYLAVYEHDYSSSNSDIDIHARRIGRDGSPASSTFAVVQSGFQELHPDVAVNSTNGEYLVAWEHVAGVSNHDVKAALVSSAGVPGSPFPVAVVSTTSEAYPAVAYNATRNEYLVVWQQATVDNYVIRGRRISATGALLGSVITVGNASSSISSGSLPYQPDVAWDSVNDRYLVVWATYTGSEYDISGQRVSGDGALLGDSLVIENWQHDQIKPKAAFNQHWAEFMVAWEDHHWANGAARDIYARRIDDSGALNGDRLGVAGGLDGNERLNPAIAYKASVREYMVVYEHVYYLSGHDVMRRRLGADGEMLEDEKFVINTGSDEQLPTIAADDGGLYLVAWEDDRNASTTETDIYAALPATDYFSGHVYDGTSWDSVTPLAGVTVQLYCSDTPSHLGTLLQTTTTDAQGGYSLMTVRNCELWNIVETDPDGYQSVTARSTDGEFVEANQLRYEVPLTGKDLTGNDFMDTPETGTDDLPPSAWANFAPAGWVNDQTVTASVNIQDTGSGLNVGSAEFAYSTDGGATWGDWRPATCSGSNGTTAVETIAAANVPFGQDSAANGQNRIKFRISDMQDNQGVSGVYGVAIDSTAPPKPGGLKSTSHQTAVWSNDNTVDASWNAVADGGSGLKGYTVEWSKATNTTPDVFLDTSTTSATSAALENSDLWYVHVAAMDEAGNRSGVAHLGPFFIDALAPVTSVGSLNPYQGTLTFKVDWSEATTYGSPLTGYDIKVVETWDGGSHTSTWKNNTKQTSADYSGILGHTYAFYSRGRDAAGNQEAYPPTPDATTTVGKDMVVTVVDESNTRVPDAEAFFNGAYVGDTDHNGEWVAKNVLIGDELAARLLVYSHLATKPDHSFPNLSDSVSWDWNAYITTVGFDAAGNPQVFQVTSMDQAPTLKLRKSQSLIGFHFIVSVEWDADAAYLADLEQGLHRASAYFYDVTDGQMLFDTTVVLDNDRFRNSNDMRVLASNNIRPHAAVNGITKGTTKHIYIGRAWGYSWGTRSFETIVHEFGHYGLNLYDEYLDADGDENTGAFCATNALPDPNLIPYDRKASFMWHEHSTSEMCSTVDPNHTHNTDTEQHAKHGECCWATVQKKYDDNNQNDRWLILTPMDRGAIMPGPDTIPVADWSRVTIDDEDTKACAPFTVTINMQPWFLTSTPAGADVYLLPKNTGSAPITQGRPNQAGQIAILGAHDGDTLSVTFFGLPADPANWPAMTSTMTIQETIKCTAAAAEPAAVKPLEPVPDAFTLHVSVNSPTEDRIQVQVEPTTELSAAPAVTLWQEGAGTSTDVALVAEASGARYVGQAALDPDHAPAGLLHITARDKQGNEVWTIHDFALTPVKAGDQTSQIYSDDGVARLSLRAGSLSADAVIVLQAAQGGSPGDLVLVGGPYAIGSDDVPLAGDATVLMTYATEQAAGAQPSSLRLYRWDAQNEAWVAQASNHDDLLHLVSARVKNLGVFAILGQPANQQRLMLPVITNQSGSSAASHRDRVAGEEASPVDVIYLPLFQ